MPGGRPSTYSEDTANLICARLAAGEPLTKICKDADMPDVVTVYRWRMAHPEFSNAYACAREDQADTLASEIIEISDDGSRDYSTDEDGVERVDHDHIQRSKLRVDARKWYASKLAPKKYSDRTEITGAAGGPVAVDHTVADRPQLTKEEWLALHAMGTAAK